MIEVILVIYFNSNPALTPLQKRPFQLANLCRKICDFNVDFWKIFWGHSPQTPILKRDPTPGGT